MLTTDLQDGGDDLDVHAPHHGTAGDPIVQDPVASLHDTTEEAGDESGLADIYLMDLRSANALGVALDASDESRPDLA